MLKTTDVKMINSSDWDDLVKDTYGRRYSFQQQNGCRERGIFSFRVPDYRNEEDFENDTVPEEVNHPEMGVSLKAWLNRDPEQPLKNQEDDYELDLWWNRNFYPDTQTLANNLYQRSLLEKGEYVINIDW